MKRITLTPEQQKQLRYSKEEYIFFALNLHCDVHEIKFTYFMQHYIKEASDYAIDWMLLDLVNNGCDYLIEAMNDLRYYWFKG